MKTVNALVPNRWGLNETNSQSTVVRLDKVVDEWTRHTCMVRTQYRGQLVYCVPNNAHYNLETEAGTS